MSCITNCLNIIFWILFIMYILVPLVLYMFPQLLTKLIFFHLYYCPHYSRNFSDFNHYGLNGDSSRNFYLTNNDGHKLGVWHLEPEVTSEKEFEKKLLDGRPVVLYFHGNALNRGGRHMVDLYKRLLKQNLHLLAIDYRGYGDSDGVPTTEYDVVHDAEILYRYATQTVGVSRVHLWGHSLGTGVVSHLAKIVSQSGKADTIASILLESPFNNISDGVRMHHFSLPYKYTPYFERVFVDGVASCGIEFNSEENLRSVDSPILIVHAADDFVVPLELGRRLYSRLKLYGRLVRLVALQAGRGYRHVNVWRSDTLYREFRAVLDGAKEWV